MSSDNTNAVAEGSNAEGSNAVEQCNILRSNKEQ